VCFPKALGKNLGQSRGKTLGFESHDPALKEKGKSVFGSKKGLFVPAPASSFFLGCFINLNSPKKKKGKMEIDK